MKARARRPLQDCIIFVLNICCLLHAEAKLAGRVRATVVAWQTCGAPLADEYGDAIQCTGIHTSLTMHYAWSPSSVLFGWLLKSHSPCRRTAVISVPTGRCMLKCRNSGSTMQHQSLEQLQGVRLQAPCSRVPASRDLRHFRQAKIAAALYVNALKSNRHRIGRLSSISSLLVAQRFAKYRALQLRAGRPCSEKFRHNSTAAACAFSAWRAPRRSAPGLAAHAACRLLHNSLPTILIAGIAVQLRAF